jgi:hypothetical protein
MRRMNWTRSLWIGAALLLTGSTANADGVHIALVGATNVVAGQDFEIQLAVTQPGTPFNGYDATIAWDPAELTFVAASPIALQEGTYMTSACGTTFHWFQQAATSVQISHVIWCAGMRLTGPGELYRLQFRATGSRGTTHVTIAANEFYAAGYTVPTASAASATIVIGSPTDVATTAASLKLDAAPNPFQPLTTLLLQAPESGRQVILVHDVAGRLVRNLDRGSYAAGPRRVSWDGRDNDGLRLASGTYWITLQAGDSQVTKRVVLVR